MAILDPMSEDPKNIGENFNATDDSLIDYFLALSPEERIKQHQKALQLATDIKTAGCDYYARLRESSQATPRK